MATAVMHILKAALFEYLQDCQVKMDLNSYF